MAQKMQFILSILSFKEVLLIRKMSLIGITFLLISASLSPVAAQDHAYLTREEVWIEELVVMTLRLPISDESNEDFKLKNFFFDLDKKKKNIYLYHLLYL